MFEPVKVECDLCDISIDVIVENTSKFYDIIVTLEHGQSENHLVRVTQKAT